MSGWSGAAALLGLGLTVGQAMAVTVGAQIIIVCVWILTGFVGAYWHVSFPMWNRSVWGLRAAYFPVRQPSRVEAKAHKLTPAH